MKSEKSKPDRARRPNHANGNTQSPPPSNSGSRTSHHWWDHLEPIGKIAGFLTVVTLLVYTTYKVRAGFGQFASEKVLTAELTECRQNAALDLENCRANNEMTRAVLEPKVLECDSAMAERDEIIRRLSSQVPDFTQYEDPLKDLTESIQQQTTPPYFDSAQLPTVAGSADHRRAVRLFNRGVAESESGIWLKAAASYLAALELAPGLEGARSNLALTWYHLADYRRSLETLGELPQLRACETNLQALAHYRLGNLSAAKYAFERSLEDEPHAITSANLALTLIRLEQFAQARALCERSTLEFPGCGQVKAMLGLARWKAGDAEGAADAYRDAIDITPDDPNLLRDLGTVLYRLDRFADAIDVLARGCGLAPRDPKMRYLLALARAATGDSDTALDEYKAALRLDYRFVDARYSLARSLIINGQYAQAIHQLAAVIELEPDMADGWALLGVAYARMDNLDTAMAYYRCAVDLGGRSGLGHFNLACALAQQGRLEEAGERLCEAIDLNPMWRKKALDDTDLKDLRGHPTWTACVNVDGHEWK